VNTLNKNIWNYSFQSRPILDYNGVISQLSGMSVVLGGGGIYQWNHLNPVRFFESGYFFWHEFSFLFLLLFFGVTNSRQSFKNQMRTCNWQRVDTWKRWFPNKIRSGKRKEMGESHVSPVFFFSSFSCLLLLLWWLLCVRSSEAMAFGWEKRGKQRERLLLLSYWLCVCV
jgi:hypothetical protein